VRGDADEAKRVKITNQFRTRTGISYDLKCDGARLTVCITQRRGPSDEGEWRVEARTKLIGEEASLESWGPTRRDALVGVGKEWASRSMELGLPSFDWDAVATALGEVKAL
jgi:hypothetical protein